jgi:protein-L-isoaspartate O-methyltransferase
MDPTLEIATGTPFDRIVLALLIDLVPKALLAHMHACGDIHQLIDKA